MTEFQAAGWVGLIVGTVGLVQAVRFRAGVGAFRLTRPHLERTMPLWTRNSVFAGIPLNLGITFIGIGMTAGETDMGWFLAWIAASVIAIAFGVAIWASPPEWSKPRWWREADAAGWKGSVPRVRRSDTVITAVLSIVYCSSVVIIATHVRFSELIGPIILALGIGLGFLAARVRGR